MYDLAKRILEVLKKAGRPLTGAEIHVVLVGVHKLSVDAHSVNRCLRSIENALVVTDTKGRWLLLHPELVPTKKTATPAPAMPVEETTNARSLFRWGLCRECGHRTKATRQDLSHASPPRCSTCGGFSLAFATPVHRSRQTCSRSVYLAT